MYGRAEAIRIGQTSPWRLQVRTGCRRSPLPPELRLECPNTHSCTNAVGFELVESDDLHDHPRRRSEGHRFTVQLLLRLYPRTSIWTLAPVLQRLDQRSIESSCRCWSAGDRRG